MVNHVIVGYDRHGQYYRWGAFGIRYYVNEHGDMRARRLAYRDGESERLSGGY